MASGVGAGRGSLRASDMPRSSRVIAC
jgi:hypothetical protein